MGQHLTVMEQFDKAAREGSLYPRWQPEFNRGYGLPWLNFYPPGFYYFAEVFRLMVPTAIDAFLAACLFLMAASGIAAYALARLFFSRSASAAGALFYMLTPYHTVDLYLRGALPELTGFFFVPAILFFAYKAGEHARPRHIAALALFQGLYFMSHFPVAYLLSLTLGLYALVWAVMKRDAMIPVRIGAGIIVGLLMSAAFWLVALVERVYVREPFSAVFQYHESYLNFGSNGDSFTGFVNSSFLALAFAIVVSLVAARGFATASTQTKLFQILAVATLFMVTPWSIHISKLIPNVNVISFAWRWLVIVSCFAGISVALALETVITIGRERRLLRWSLAAALAAVFGFNLWTSVAVIRSALGSESQATPSQRDEHGYLPAGAVDPPSLPDTERARLVRNSGTVEITSWRSLRREMNVRPAGNSVLRLRTFTFPGWKATVDGRPVAVDADSDGAQLIAVPSGSHRVIVTFENTPIRTWAAALSSLAFLIAIVVISVDRG